MKNNPSALKIGQAAKILGVSIDTLRRWEKNGKISAIRTPGGTRLYSQAELQKINPASFADFQVKGISTEELLKEVENEKVSEKKWSFDTEVRSLDSAPAIIKKNLFSKLIISSAVLSAITLLITGWITASYLTTPQETQQFMSHNIASPLLKPFNMLAESMVAVISPKHEEEPPPILNSQLSIVNSNVLAVTSASRFLEVNADAQINGALSVRDSINGLSLEATPSASNFTLNSGSTTLTVTKTAKLDQDVSTTASPSFSALTLSSTTEQLLSGTNKFTLPSSSTTLIGKDSTDTLTNKSISGSSNTLTNIPNSALTNAKITVTAGTNLTGGGDITLGGSGTLSLKDSISIGTLAVSGALTQTGAASFASTVTLTGTSSSSGTALCLNSSNLVAQCAAGSSVTGTGSAGSLAFWSSSTALTYNASLFYNTSTTNVGIGTSSPSSKLDVIGTLGVTGVTTLSANNAALSFTGTTPSLTSGSSVFGLFAGGNVGIGTTSTLGSSFNVNGNQVIGSSFIGGAAPSNGLAVQGNVGIGTSSPLAALHVVGAGTNTATFVNGNVGIGTSVPSNLLELSNADNNPQLRLADTQFSTNTYTTLRTVNTSGTNGVLFDINLFPSDTSQAANIRLFRSTNTSGRTSIDVYRGNNTSTINSSLAGFGDSYLNALTGNVGIGTASPLALLYVAGNSMIGYSSGGPGANMSNSLAVSGNLGVGTSSPSQKFQVNLSTSNPFVVTSGGNVGIGFTSPINPLVVSGAGTIGSGYNLYTAPSNGLIVQGNVGIGNSAPSYTLDVTGTGRFSSNLTVGGTLGITGVTTLSANNAALSFTGTTPSLTSGSSVFGLFAGGNVGIGTTSTMGSSFNVNGNQIIGASFIGGAAPANGLAVSGNVGIGTSTTTQALTINGNIALVSGYSIYGQGSNQYLTMTTNGGSKLFYNGSNSINVGSSTFVVTTSGTDRAQVDSSGNLGVYGGGLFGFSSITATPPLNGLGISGNVGVGTTTANYNLDVVGTGHFTGALTFDSTLAVTGASTFSSTGSFAGALTLSASNAALSFTGSTPSLTSGSSVFGLFAGGNVGIGTTGNIYGGLTVRGAGTGTNITLQTYGSGLGQGLTVLDNGNVGVGTTSPSQVFQVNLSTSNPVVITSGGNLGIGWTSPINKLEVAGAQTIGIGYAGVYTAPSNGLLVQGNVGIGTSNGTGAFNLDVAGTGRFSSNLTAGGTLGVTGAATFSSTGSFASTLSLANGTATTPSLNFSNSTGSGLWYNNVTNQISLTTAGVYNSGININASGNVGIGVTNASSALNVIGNVGIGTSAAGSALAVNGGGLFGWGTASSAAPSNGLAIFGNVGIGTTSPSQKLEVLGIIQSTNPGTSPLGSTVSLTSPGSSPGLVITEGDGSGGTLRRWDEYVSSGAFYLKDNTGSAIRMSINTSGNVGIGNTNPGTMLSLSGNTTIGFGGATSIAGPSNGLAVSGNIGIGTTTASQKLEVVGGNIFLNNTSNLGIRAARGSDSTQSNILWVQSQTSGTLQADSTIVGSIGNSAIQFVTNTTNSRMLIDLYGNVGIGTSAMSSNFQVAGNSVIGWGTTAVAGPTNGLGISGNLGVGTTTANAKLSVIGSGLFGADYGGYTPSSNGLLVQGNVGIGATSAVGYNLDVWGTARVTGAATLSSTLAVTGASTFSSTGSFASTLSLANGTATTPALNFTNSTGSGLWYNNVTNQISLTTAGVYNSGININASGNVGIGTTNASQAFQVNASGTSAFVVNSSGNVGIGWTNPIYNLTFGGTSNQTIGVMAQQTANTAGASLTLQSAAGNGTGTGGALALTAGAGTTGNSSTGGAITITAGSGFSAGFGGAVTVTGGSGNSGGAGGGGAVTIAGGSGSGGGSSGGAVTLTGGNSTDGGTPGAITIAAGKGTGTSTAAGGAISLTSGAGGAVSGNSGNLTLATGIFTSGNFGNIIFKQGTNVRATFDANGNLGIGTSVPGSVLNVIGNVGIGTSTAGSALQINGGGIFWPTTASLSLASGTSIGTNGNVGVGTTTANYNLDVVGTGHFTGALTFDSTLAVTGASTFSSTGSFASTLSLANGTATTPALNFTNSTGSGLWYNNVTNQISLTTAGVYNSGININASGNVGIGVTNAVAALQVAGDVFTGNSGLSAGSAHTTQIINSTTSPVSSRLAFGTDGTGWKFAIAKNQSGSISDLFTIQDNGNVGIGTTGPGSALTVIGNVGIGISTSGASLQVNGGGIFWPSTTSLSLAAGTSIGTNGNVGVGTTTASHNLEVIGTGAFSSTLSLADGSATTPALNFTNSTGIGLWSPAANILALTSGTPTTPATVNGLAINSNGNVGIGTSNPTQRLEIGGNGSFSLGATATSGNTPNILIGGFVTGTGVRTNEIRTNTSGDLEFTSWNAFRVFTNATSGSAGAGTQYLTLTNTGLLGINSATPNSRLDVRDTGTGTSLTALISSGGGNFAILQNGNVGIGLSNPGSRLAVTGNVGIGTSAAGAALQINGGGIFWPTTASLSLASGTSIGTNGNVGVGTTTANYNLDVVGTGHFTGALTFDSTLAVTGASTFSSTGSFAGALTLSANNAALSFTGTTPSLTSGSSVFGLFAGGNVGIGTTGPLAGALTVKGTGTSTGLSFLTTDSSGTQRFGITDAGNVGIGTTSPLASLYVNGNAMIGYSSGAGGSGFSSTSLAVAGNLGIGTTSPASKLVIGGDSGSANVKLAAIGFERSTFTPGVNAAEIQFWRGGSADEGALAFVTKPTSGSLTERMRIAEGGNVGVGTTNPTATFAVGTGATSNFTVTSAGVVSIASTLAVTGVTTLSANSAALSFTGTTPSLTSGSSVFGLFAGGNVGIGTTGNLYGGLTVRGAGTSTGITLQTYGSDLTQGLTALDNGNVGIGTTGPIGKFQVNLGNNQLAILNDAVNASGVSFINGSILGQSSLFQIATIANNPMTFYTGATRNSMTVGTERMRLDANGNFGIGYNSIPNATLAVNGNVGIGTSSPSQVFQVNLSTSNNAVVINSSGNLGIGISAPINRLDISGGQVIGTSYAGLYTAPSSGLLVQGNIGIANSAPSFNLDVIGTGRFSSNLTVGGTLTVSGTQTFTGASTFSSQILASDGTAALPGYSFSSDTNTGIFRASTDALDFVTGGTERLTITAAGNIGIGITAPTSPLTIINSATTQLRIGSSVSTLELGTNSGSNAVWAYDRTNTTWKGLDIGSSQLTFGIGGSEKMRIDTTGNVGIGYAGGVPGAALAVNGNVGIGTSSANALLDISGTSYSQRFTNTSATGLSGLQFYEGTTIKSDILQIGSNHGTAYRRNSLEIWNESTGRIDFYTGATVKASFDTNGNLGIGTTSPSQALHVIGSGQFSSSILNADGTAALPAFSFASDTDNGLWRIGSNQIALTTGGGSHSGLAINSSGNVGIGNTSASQPFQVNASGTSAFVVNSSGNVGIGFTNPIYNLTFAGTSNQTIGVMAQQTANTAGVNLALTGAAGNGSGAGGAVNITSGTGGASGVGGAVAITAGTGGTNAGGGTVSITGGLSVNSAGGSGNGGNVNITGGVSGASSISTGGNITITSGAHDTDGGATGTVTIATADHTGSNQSGGTNATGILTIKTGVGVAGTSTNAGTGSGAITIQTQNAGGSVTGIGGAGGAITLTLGNGGTTTGAGTPGVGGAFSVTAGNGGGTTTTTGGAAGTISLTAGNGGVPTGAGTGVVGGNVTLTAGNGSLALAGGALSLTGGVGGATGTGGAISLISGLGGSTSGGSGQLLLATGTTTSGTVGPIVFRNGNTLSGAFDANGNLGIGYTAPTSTLFVNGNSMIGYSSGGPGANMSNSLAVSGNLGVGTSSPSQVFQVNLSTSNPVVITSGGNLGIGTTSPIAILHPAGNLTGYTGGQLVITGTNQNQRMYIGYRTDLDQGFIQPHLGGSAYKDLILNPLGGNVGVGTTAPTATFAVGTGATSNFTVTSAGVVSIASTLGVTGVTTLSANSAALSFTGTTPSLTSGGSVFGLFAGGNVGIGTTGNLYGGLTVRGAGTGTNITLQTYGSNLTQGLTVLDNGNVGIGTTTPVGGFQVGANATSSLYVSAINSGNVGIGTTIPGAKLEITGNLLFSKETARTISVADTTATNTAGALLTLQGAAGAGSGAGGALTFTAGAGGSSGVGGAVNINGGAGGTATTGGAVVISSGSAGGGGVGSSGAISISTGGANGTGTGGAITITGNSPSSIGSGTANNASTISIAASTGGLSSAATGTGGIGSTITFTTGTGGVASGNTSSTGGAGGAFSVTGGNGGLPTGTTTAIGGAGGAISLTAGNGVAPTSGSSNTGGAAGTLSLTSGNGALGTAGGLLSLTAGNGGATGVGGGLSFLTGNGGSTSGGSGQLLLATGTTTSGTVGPIVFRNGNTLSGAFDANGNLGIGYTAPTSTLYVNGNAMIGYSSGAPSSLSNGLAVSGNIGIGTTNPLFLVHARSTNNGINGIAVGNDSNGASAQTRFQLYSDRSSSQNQGLLATYSSGSTLTAFGQTLADWVVLASDGTLNNGLMVGTSTSDPVILGTNLTERMRIASGGNIGIGNSNPTALLTVGTAGAANFTVTSAGVVSIASTLGVTGATTLSSTLAVTGASTFSSTGSFAGALTLSANNAALSFTGTTPSLTSGSSVFGLFAGGNVGIGTTSTLGSSFNVNGNQVIGSSFIGGAAPSNGLAVQGNVGIGITTTSALLHLQTQDSAGTTVSMKIQSGVGSGSGQTADLLEFLNSSGTIRAYFGPIGGSPTNFQFTIGTNNNNGLSFIAGGIQGGTNTLISWGSGGLSSSNSITMDTGIARNAAGVLEVNNGTAGTLRDIQLRAINPASGNVGIGMTNPLANLYINGNAMIGYSSGAGGSGLSSTSLAVAGNVGIGTTNPLSSLQVGAIAATTGNLPTSNNTAVFAGTPNLSDTNGPGQIMLVDETAFAADRGGRIVFNARTNTTQTASLAGIAGLKENATAGNFAGYLQFMTRSAAGSNAERVRIDSTGNIGIGVTTSINALLSVGQGATSNFTVTSAGVVSIASTLAVTGVTTLSANNAALSFTGTTPSISTSNGSFAVFPSTGNVGIGTSVPSANFVVNGNAMIGYSSGAPSSLSNGLAVSGNVGIGTTNPTAPLTIATGGTGVLAVITPGTGAITDSGSLRINGRALFGYDGSLSAVTISDAGTSKNIIFSTGSGPLERMRIDSVGNVGIGNSNPGGSMFTLAGNATIGFGGATSIVGPSSGLGISGNLGVGTTTTNYKLDVIGTGHFTGALTFDSTLAVTGVTTLSANNAALSFTGTTPSLTSGSSVFGLFAGGNVGIGTTGNVYGGLTVRGAGTSTGITLQTYGSNLTQGLTVLDNGNVGIGTTSPTNILHVDKSTDGAAQSLFTNTNTGTGANVQLLLGNGSSNTGLIKLGSSYTSSGAYQQGGLVLQEASTGGLSIASIDATAAIRFYTAGTANSNERMRINSTGNLGIGTSSPTATFSVGTGATSNFTVTSAGVVSIASTLAVTGVTTLSANNAALSFTGTTPSLTSGSSVFGLFAGGNVGIGTTGNLYGGLTVRGAGTGTNITLQTYGSGLGQGLSVLDNGNVGIGTTAPTQPLHISKSSGDNGLLVANGTVNFYQLIGTSRIMFGQTFTGAAIGTSTGHDFSIGTNNLERVRVTSGGNVGIGTTSPTATFAVGTGATSNFTVTSAGVVSIASTLAVTGASTFTGALLAGDGTASAPGYSFSSDTDNGLWRIGTNQIALTTAGGAMSGLSINSSGNVGIGTTNAGYNFQLTSTGNTAAFISSGNAANNTATLALQGGREWDLIAQNSGTAPASGFRIRDANAAADRLAIDSNGNVGIGTTGPTSLLHIQNTTNAQLAIDANSTNGTRLRFLNGGSNFNWQIASQQNVSDSFEITPSTAAGGTTFSTPAFLINSSGNIGVGTNSPVADFHLVGDAALTAVNFLAQGTGGASMVSILDNGNVGIGTSAPAALLNIQASQISATTLGSSRQLLLQDTSGANTNRTEIGFGYNSSNQPVVIGHRVTDQSAATLGTFYIATRTTTTGGEGLVERLEVAAGGNVGIGATAAGSMLQLSGNAVIGFGSATSIAGPSNGLGVLGNVGIGTTSPSQALHVIGSGQFSSSILNANGSASSPSYSFSNLTNAGLWTNGDGLLLTTGGSNTKGITVTGAGFVGIGTTSPVGSLQVVGASGQGVRISGGSSARLTLVASDNSTNLWNMDNLTGTLRIFREDYSATGGGPNGSVKMAINNGGNVGIGTASPLSTLYVNGNAMIGYASGAGGSGLSSTSLAVAGNLGVGTSSPRNTFEVAGAVNGSSPFSQFTFSSTTNHSTSPQGDWATVALFNTNTTAGNYSTLEFGTNDSNTAYRTGATIQGVYQSHTAGTGVTADLAFSTRNLGTIAEAFRIRGDGNIGIGTSLPVARLQVNSTSNATVIASTGNVGIGTTTTSGSKLRIANLGSSTGTALIIDASGDVFAQSSSRRFKENIQDFSTDFTNILNVQPKSYNYIGTGAADIGYIAEDFDSLGLSDLVYHDSSGQAQSIKYDKLALYAIELLKSHQTSINNLTSALTVTNGNVGIGFSNNFVIKNSLGQGLFSVDASGSARLAGSLTTEAGAFDVAEDYQVDDLTIESGDIVALGNGEGIEKTTKAYQNNTIGIISTKPGFRLSSNPSTSSGPNRPVALNGKVPVKVSLENGPIAKGDYLTSSTTAGVAMKATKPGQMIGKALENYSAEGIGKILIFVNISYADPGNFLASLSLDSEGNLLAPKFKVDKLLISDNSLVAFDFSNTNLAQTNSTNNGTSLDVLASLKSLDQAILDVKTKQATDSAALAELKNNIASLSAVIASSSSTTHDDIAKLNLTPPDILYATGSANLASLKVTSEATFSGMLAAYDLNVSNSFKSLGTTTLGKTNVAGDLTVDGTLSVENGSELNVIGTLYLQKSLLATNLNIFNGKVLVDSSGNITTSGKVIASEVKTNKLIISNSPIASQSATLAASIGTATLSANQTKITVQTTEASESAKVFITPTTPTDKVLSVTNIKNKESFDVSTLIAPTSDINFNWWIVNTE